MAKYTRKKNKNKTRNRRKARTTKNQKGGFIDPISLGLIAAIGQGFVMFGESGSTTSSSSSSTNHGARYMADELWSKTADELQFFIKQRNRDTQYDKSRYDEDEKLIVNTYDDFPESYDISLNKMFNPNINPEDDSYISLSDINEVIEYSSKHKNRYYVTDNYDIHFEIPAKNGQPKFKYQGKHPLVICDNEKMNKLCDFEESEIRKGIKNALKEGISDDRLDYEVQEQLKIYKLYPAVILEITAHYLKKKTGLIRSRKYHILKQIQKINISGLEKKLNESSDNKDLNSLTILQKFMTLSILKTFQIIIGNVCDLKTFTKKEYHEGIERYCTKTNDKEEGEKSSDSDIQAEITKYIGLINRVVNDIQRNFVVLKLKPTETVTMIDDSVVDNTEDIETVKGEVKIIQK
jgi:hypothetical protein